VASAADPGVRPTNADCPELGKVSDIGPAACKACFAIKNGTSYYPGGVLIKRMEQQPSMIKVDDLWVHQGTPEPGANWNRVLDDIHEERINSVLKA
jgi:hypothetical protein